MFGWFKKRKAAPTSAELVSLSQSALSDVKGKWAYFNETIHLDTSIPLADRIDMFAQPVAHFFESKYPDLLAGSSEIFWLTVFTAVLESNTHPKEEVNLAVIELRRKYAGQSKETQIRR